MWGSRKFVALSTLGAGLLIAHSSRAVNYDFIPFGVGDWNVAANWTGGPQLQVPQGGAGNHAFININGTATISTTIPDIEDISVGRGTSAIGINTLIHTATNTFQGTQGRMIIGRNGGTGVYAMSGTAIQGKELMYLGTDGLIGPSLGTGTGTLTMTDNASLVLDTLEAGVGGGAFASSAAIDIADSSTFTVSNNFRLSNGTMDVTDATPGVMLGDIEGDFVIGDRSARNATLTMDYGEIRVAGDLYVGRDGSTGVVNLSGGTLRKDGGTSSSIRVGALGAGNGGTLNISGSASVISDTNMILSETAGRTGAVNQTGGYVELKNQGGAVGQESLIIDSAGSNGGSYNLSGGTLKAQSIDASSGLFDFTGGTLLVDNTFRGTLTQKGGIFSPGNTPGQAFVTGSYIMPDDEVGARLLIEIWGNIPILDYDYLNVAGNVKLNGELIIELDDELGIRQYTPAAGDTFKVLDWGGDLDGEFDSYNLEDITTTDDLYWNLSTFESDGTIRVADVADLDMDGDVDGVDLASFFAAYTGPGASLPGLTYADIDMDGDVDGVDISGAFSRFTGPNAPAVIPEPSSLILLGIGGLLIVRRKRCALAPKRSHTSSFMRLLPIRSAHTDVTVQSTTFCVTRH